MVTLDEKTIASLKSGLSKMSGYKKRSYAAELSKTYFEGSARKTERYLGLSRAMVTLGLHELRTGILCVEAYTQRGRKKKKNI